MTGILKIFPAILPIKFACIRYVLIKFGFSLDKILKRFTMGRIKIKFR